MIATEKLSLLISYLNFVDWRSTTDRSVLTRNIESHKELFGYFTLDIDNFKRVNDTYGHASGDEVLIRLADLLKYNLPPHATAIRLGGEEFGVLITTTSEKETFELAEHTRKIG
ncbi:GGDEF domain-containing protein [Chryseomicrobium aureum]|uniref:GGDEF domain-containing protein n=1 Tax=Chryseomicrobium aureum TaxID=1441723 RepID=UPI00370DDB56